MKTIFNTLYVIFMFTAIITHIWTVVIAFSNGGLLAGIISFILPVLAEIYWMIEMFGENNTYAIIALIHLLLTIPIYLFSRSNA